MVEESEPAQTETVAVAEEPAMEVEEPSMAMEEAPAMEMMESSADSYTVERGDSLWGISAQDQIYGNPYQWPLIFKANRDQIADADLIYPGQDLAIMRDSTGDEIAAAVEHARNRGAWSLGATEESDLEYLNR